MVPGQRTVAVAVGHGKRAARNIDGWLRSKTYVEQQKAPLVSFAMLHLPIFTDVDPIVQTALAAAQRLRGFEEAVGGLDEGCVLLGRDRIHGAGIGDGARRICG